MQLGSDLIFIHGNHRVGQYVDVKHQLVAKVVDDVSSVAYIEKWRIWLYINEMSANQMIEYGRFVPEPRQEIDGSISQQLGLGSRPWHLGPRSWC